MKKKVYISISNAKLPSFTHKWHTTNVLFCHPWNKTNLMLNLNCKPTVHIYTFTHLLFFVLAGKLSQQWKTCLELRSQTCSIWVWIFYLVSSFTSLFSLLLACATLKTQRNLGRVSSRSRLWDRSLSFILKTPCTQFLVFFLSSITVPQASARLDMSQALIPK